MATAQNKFLAAAASHRCVDYDGSSKEKEEEEMKKILVAFNANGVLTA